MGGEGRGEKRGRREENESEEKGTARMGESDEGESEVGIRREQRGRRERKKEDNEEVKTEARKRAGVTEVRRGGEGREDHGPDDPRNPRKEI